MFDSRIERTLNQLREDSLERVLPKIDYRQGKYIFITGEKLLNFASNDYLGLGEDQRVKLSIQENTQRYAHSSSSSRLMAGNCEIVERAEQFYAEYFGYQDCLFFPSGFQANIGLLSSLLQPQDSVLVDKHVHVSIVKGVKLSGANLNSYKHNQLSHLKKRLDKLPAAKKSVVITESLFSMDGDLLSVEELAALKRRYGFYTIVDEAHALGVMGERGTGVATTVADIAIGTWGKALGFYGAFILLPTTIKKYLLNTCSPLIYTTATSPLHAAVAIDILKMVEGMGSEREQLKLLSEQARIHLRECGFEVMGDAHILAIVIGNEKKAQQISKKLPSRGIFLTSARYPTVPLNRAILRVSLTTQHTLEDIKKISKALQDITREI